MGKPLAHIAQCNLHRVIVSHPLLNRSSSSRPQSCWAVMWSMFHTKSIPNIAALSLLIIYAYSIYLLTLAQIHAALSGRVLWLYATMTASKNCVAISCITLSRAGVLGKSDTKPVCGYMYTPRFRKLSSATPIFIIINVIIIWLGVRSSILADNVLPTMLCNFFYCLLSFNSQSVSNTRIRVAWLIARVVKDNIWIVWFLKCLIRISKVVLRLWSLRIMVAENCVSNNAW